jgi:phage-related protein
VITCSHPKGAQVWWASGGSNAVSLGESIYVIHAFQKKSKAGIATPKPGMDMIRQRLGQSRSEVKDAKERNP